MNVLEVLETTTSHYKTTLRGVSGHRFLPLSAVLGRCRRLQDLVLQGTMKSTRKKSQQKNDCSGIFLSI